MEAGFKDIEIGAAVEPFSGARGEGNARELERFMVFRFSLGKRDDPGFIMNCAPLRNPTKNNLRGAIAMLEGNPGRRRVPFFVFSAHIQVCGSWDDSVGQLLGVRSLGLSRASSAISTTRGRWTCGRRDKMPAGGGAYHLPPFQRRRRAASS